MTTISTIFSGGEGVGVGARMAGINHLWGIEYDDKIAQVARNNNFDTLTADVLDVDPGTLQVPDVLHASPVCTNASVANTDGEEAELDIATATKTAEFISVMQPKFFTLENVYPYRHFKSFHIICDALHRNGYSFDYWHLNSADYGVPQTRKRLILIAKLDGGHNRIAKPEPTHHNPAKVDDNQMMLFAPTTKPWVGWYEAIEDLIPFLSESEFAPWQLDRLPEHITGSKTFVFEPTEMRENGIQRIEDEPICTIKATRHGNFRAFLFNGMDMKSTGRDMNGRDIDEPSATVVASDLRRPSTIPSALIVDGKLNDNSSRLTSRDGESPTFTVTTSHNNRDVKAYITSGGNTYTPTLPDGEHGFTIGASHSTHGHHKALLIPGDNASNDTIREAVEPTTTVNNTNRVGNVPRAWLSQGRVVKMTPRALARFQSFPEWYRFPDGNSLAVKVIGNAVPPLMYSKIIQSAIE